MPTHTQATWPIPAIGSTHHHIIQSTMKLPHCKYMCVRASARGNVCKCTRMQRCRCGRALADRGSILMALKCIKVADIVRRGLHIIEMSWRCALSNCNKKAMPALNGQRYFSRAFVRRRRCGSAIVRRSQGVCARAWAR